MTPKIQQVIDEIRSKALKMHDQLIAERAVSDELRKELAELRSTISVKEAQEAVLFADIEKLKGELEATRTQFQGDSDLDKRNRDEEIDELVKEIEYCISQLKNKA